MRRWRTELAWLGLVALLLLLSVWWIPGSGSVLTDSFSVTFVGKKALYQSLRRLDGSVARSTHRLVPEFSEGDRLLILGPARSPSSDEWNAIKAAVASGMSLVYAVSDNDPVVDLEPFGVRIKEAEVEVDSLESKPPAESSSEKPADDKKKRKRPKQNLFSSPQTATTSLVSESVTWRHPRPIEPSGASTASLTELGWETLVSVKEEPQVIRKQFGLGTIVVVNSDDIFSNQSMLDDDQALLAIRIIESAESDGTTWFDETLNSSGTPKVFGILFDSQFRPMTLQLILVAVLFGWSGARRFGPAFQNLVKRRRSIVEHAEALGILYFHSRAGAQAVAQAQEHFRSEIRRQFGSGFRVDDPVALARLAQTNVEDVQKLLRAANEVAHSASPTNAQAAKVLRDLAQLRQRICGEQQTRVP